MPRVKPGKTTRAWHKKWRKMASGAYGARSKKISAIMSTVQHAGNYAFRDRKNKKRDFRRLWIQRINAGTRGHGLSYSVFINGLRKANVSLDRKSLSELAIHDPAAFDLMVETARSARV